MKFCKYCGTRIDSNARFCECCGRPCNDVSEDTEYTSVSAIDYGSPNGTDVGGYVADNRPSGFVAVISFVFTLVGLILMGVYKNKRPGRYESALKGTLGGLCFGIPLLGLILFITWRNEFPSRAKVMGISALVGLVSGVVLVVGIYVALFAVLLTAI